MDREKALEILELSSDATPNEIKKGFYKLALKYHPDKFKSDDLDEKNKNCDKFKNINLAYEYLKDGKNNSEPSNKEFEMNYTSILKACINFIYPSNNWDDLYIKTTIESFVNNCEDISIEIFKKLSKDKCCEFYDFIANYFILFDIENTELLDKMRKICHDKMRDDNIIVLTPSMNDLLKDNVYKLQLSNTSYYIPLWHNKLYFDISGNDLIVLIKPDIDDSIKIDRHNNIILSVKKEITEVFNDDKFTYDFEGKILEIESNKITITKTPQTFSFRNCGIARINEDNIYSNKERGDIFINLELVNNL